MMIALFDQLQKLLSQNEMLLQYPQDFVQEPIDTAPSSQKISIRMIAPI